MAVAEDLHLDFLIPEYAEGVPDNGRHTRPMSCVYSFVRFILAYFSVFCKWLDQKKALERGTFHKAGFSRRKKQKEYGQFVRTPFHTPCYARYSVLHLLDELSGGNEPPLCKGSLWFVRPESPSIFLTSTAFVDTKASPAQVQQRVIVQSTI